jgi:D-glycero-alpha-D-manno-heptose-7-phosphate kinase
MVCLLHALEAHKGRRVSPAWLAKEAIRYERDVLLDTVGYQDQVAAAFGGLNIIHFLPGGNFRVEPLVLPQERKRTLGRHLMLFLRALPVQHRKSHKHRLPTWTEKRPN